MADRSPGPRRKSACVRGCRRFPSEMGAAIAIVRIAHRRSTIALPRRPFFGPVVPQPSRERLPRGTGDADASGKMRVLAAPRFFIPIHTVQKRFALRYAYLMIRLFGTLAAFLAICPIGVYYAGSSTASPPGGPGQCSFVLEGPKVVNVSGVNYVMATLQAGSCALHAHTESTATIRPDCASRATTPNRRWSTTPTDRARRMSSSARDVRTPWRAARVRPRPRRFARTSRPRVSGCSAGCETSTFGRRSIYTGSNPEISQRPSTLSSVTRTLDAVSVGGLLSTVAVWLTKSRVTAWSGVADTEAAAGT